MYSTPEEDLLIELEHKWFLDNPGASFDSSPFDRQDMHIKAHIRFIRQSNKKQISKAILDSIEKHIDHHIKSNAYYNEKKTQFDKEIEEIINE